MQTETRAAGTLEQSYLNSVAGELADMAASLERCVSKVRGLGDRAYGGRPEKERPKDEVSGSSVATENVRMKLANLSALLGDLEHEIDRITPLA